MSERIHVLAQRLFGKPSVAACDLEEIKTLAHSYPYFAPAQFLLLEKLKQDNDPGYTAQLQKAVLYYHNPLDFEYFIASDKFYTDVDFDAPIQEPRKEEEVLQEETIPARREELSETASIGPDEEGISVKLPPDNDEEESEEEKELSDNQFPSVEMPSLKLTPLVSGETELPAFEPFHTVDYFASQGIKLSQDEQPKDKFGKQLKSFTEWLKTMKRLPAQQGTRPIDTSSENKVQHLAEDSVHESDVITEAMAEVWLKQGNFDKALEVYNKLSLLNPSKKAYFAGKIENLKRS
jgi:hypothetical protein